MRRPLAILILLGVVIASTFRPIQAQGDPASEMFRLVNEVRARNGLPPFQWNGQLAAAAQNQSNYMAENNVYSHSGYGGSTPLSRAEAQGYFGRVSENVVGGTKLSPRGGVLWWENSAVHLQNMLATQHVDGGIGFAQGHDQNFYTLVIGHKSGEPAPILGSVPADEPAPLRVTPITLAEPREDGSIVHVLQQGQALWTVAAYYDVDLDFLMQINNVSDGDFVINGQEILVRPPDDWVPPPTPTPPSSHIVQEGENLWYIAYLYDLEMPELLWLNGIDLDVVLQPGRELRVRLLPGETPPPTPTPQLTHFVASGETLWAIAINYGLSLDELLAYNNLEASALLHVGDELWIRPKPVIAPTATTTPIPTVQSTIAAEPAQPTLAPTQVIAAIVPTTVPTPEPVAAEPTGGISVGIVALAVGFVLLAGGAVAMAVRTR
ncbi:MAG: LysM peptidoglycan-binding domain-containing protein [Anaerolineae bacterium]|nr:LysM peptidoglycan-binding domain-containing protein [Anaerolineae bacterium]